MKNRINLSVSILRFGFCLISMLGILLFPSSLPVIGCEDEDSVCKKKKLAEVLFGLEEGSADAETYYDYNDYGDNYNETINGVRYIGGHSGWDVQTQSVAGHNTANEVFYSLTAGKVIRATKGTYRKSAVIAVYNEKDRKTVLYLHARYVDVSKDDSVIVGSRLGIQGNTGLGTEETDTNTAEHVHIEVQEGMSIEPSWGTEDMGSEERKVYRTIDPIQYLYESVQSSPVSHDQAKNGNFWDSIVIFLKDLFTKADKSEGGGASFHEDEAVTIGEGQIFVGNMLISHLDSLFGAMIPEEMALLANYPNPFNPETWIPYQLAKPSNVTLRISAADGKVVKTFEIGHQPAGLYQDRSRAVYWNGRNEVGERVASGLYFYTLSAGEFTATRRMLILK
ncbi:MAG: peptidoglycan DD-metalloendopeptidase family protein [Candidatus Poribacteria bacterium]|nr:peptidoglycan DD-metalloendopeptidase family protein [Candidatus Poribacteria bacterium]